MPVGDLADGAKVPDGLLEAGIRGRGLSECLGFLTFVHVLGRNLVNVELGVMGPELMGPCGPLHRSRQIDPGSSRGM